MTHIDSITYTHPLTPPLPPTTISYTHAYLHCRHHQYLPGQSLSYQSDLGQLDPQETYQVGLDHPGCKGQGRKGRGERNKEKEKKREREEGEGGRREEGKERGKEGGKERGKEGEREGEKEREGWRDIRTRLVPRSSPSHAVWEEARSLNHTTTLQTNQPWLTPVLLKKYTLPLSIPIDSLPQTVCMGAPITNSSKLRKESFEMNYKNSMMKACPQKLFLRLRRSTSMHFCISATPQQPRTAHIVRLIAFH